MMAVAAIVHLLKKSPVLVHTGLFRPLSMRWCYRMKNEAFVPEFAQQPGVDESFDWHVVCLCAAWCGVCRQYQADWEALKEQYPQISFTWLDVEDDEDVLGDMDVATFPTILLACGAQVQFFGPVLPQIQVLMRMLRSHQDHGPVLASNTPALASAQQLWQKIQT